MRKHLFFLLIIYGLMVACGNHPDENSTSSQDMSNMEVKEDTAGKSVTFGTEVQPKESEQQDTKSQADDSATSNKDVSTASRKVIYHANLQIEVKDFQQSFDQIQSQAAKMDGYIVESTKYEEEEAGGKSGQITARVPQDKFEKFIEQIEERGKVLESSMTGQDVTEEYVDLEARLKSRKAVEKRLLTFLEEAEKTKDLLQISSDLGEVQEQMEELIGKMNYLEDKSDLATISIHLQEKNVKISGTGKDDLNTWEQTKQQFMKSINVIITAFSGLFVFFAGNLPIFIIIGIIALVMYMIIKKRRGKQQDKQTNRLDKS